MPFQRGPSDSFVIPCPMSYVASDIPEGMPVVEYRRSRAPRRRRRRLGLVALVAGMFRA